MRKHKQYPKQIIPNDIRLRHWNHFRFWVYENFQYQLYEVVNTYLYSKEGMPYQNMQDTNITSALMLVAETFHFPVKQVQENVVMFYHPEFEEYIEKNLRLPLYERKNNTFFRSKNIFHVGDVPSSEMIAFAKDTQLKFWEFIKQCHYFYQIVANSKDGGVSSFLTDLSEDPKHFIDHPIAIVKRSQLAEVENMVSEEEDLYSLYRKYCYDEIDVDITSYQTPEEDFLEAPLTHKKEIARMGYHLHIEETEDYALVYLKCPNPNIGCETFDIIFFNKRKIEAFGDEKVLICINPNAAKHFIGVDGRTIDEFRHRLNIKAFDVNKKIRWRP